MYFNLCIHKKTYGIRLNFDGYGKFDYCIWQKYALNISRSNFSFEQKVSFSMEWAISLFIKGTVK